MPVLNQQQLVSTWKWTVPPGERWQSQNVTVPVSEKGVYLVEATEGTLRAYTIVVVTEIAVITKAAPGRLLSYVVDRHTGDPIAGAMTRLWIDQKEIASKQTDQQGLMDTAVTQDKPENVAVLVTYNDQFAVNTPGAWNLGSASDRNLRGYTYTDRPVYRPGDTVHFKTIVRSENPSGYTLPQQRDLRLELRDPRTYQPIWQQTVKLSDMGTAHWDYVIPADANLGFYYLSMQSGERYVEGTRFSVQDYKKPEYAVKVIAQTPRVLQGQPIKATIDARYYFGEPVANAKVKWVVHTSTYWPIGTLRVRLRHGRRRLRRRRRRAGRGDTYGGEQETEKSGTLDADGKLQITIPTRVNNKTKQDLTYRIEARVTDAGNREISGHGFALATYGSFYLTAQPNSYVYSKGGTAIINVSAQDYDKKPIATAFRAEFSRWNWQKRSGELISTSQGQTDASGKGQVQFVIPDAGEFRVRITAVTPEKREVEDTAYLWAPGESPWWSGTTQERIQIVADKKSYVPGDTAHVLIVTGKEPASVLVTAEGNGLYSAQVIKSSGGSITVDVPIQPEFAPNFYVSAIFIRGNKLYQGNKSLTVPPTQHELKVDLQPSKPQYQPGQPGAFTIKATDPSGKPVSAEFSLGVVDEAIYAIEPESVGNIVTAFYGTVYSKVSTDSSLTYYFSGQAGKRAMQLAGRRGSQLIRARPTQARAPGAAQDSQGLPRHRLLGGRRSHRQQRPGDRQVRLSRRHHLVARHHARRHARHQGRQRGREHHRAQEPDGAAGGAALLPPRRPDHAFDDRAELPAHGKDSARFDGVHRPAGDRRRDTKTFRCPSRGMVKVDYRVRVLDVDSAKVLGKALTDVESDAMELTLPVVPFGVKLAIAKSGSVAGAGNSDVTQQMTFPAGAESGTRKLTIEVTPSIAGTVFAALDFLTSYPYGCTEQTMSSFLPDVLVADAMKKLGVGTNIDPQTLNKQVQAGLDRLYQYQHPDGGWGWWQTDDSQPFMTAYVLAGLAQAKSAGYDVEQNRIDRARKWLVPEFTRSTAVKTDLRAYMAYALVLSGTDSNAAIVDSVWNQRSTLTSYGKALLGLAMAQINDCSRQRSGEAVDLRRQAG